MRFFEKSSRRWWQKPLVELEGRPLPAELAVLQAELRPGEAGAWLNSRGVVSGVVDVISKSDGHLASVRIQLPRFVSEVLRSLYETFGQKRGVPDLVLWDSAAQTMRFIEVKCPDWDSPSDHQVEFHSVAHSRGIPVSIVEWRFKK